MTHNFILEKTISSLFHFRYLDFHAGFNIMDLKIVNTGNTTNISTISTTVRTTTPSNITRTVSFKIIWKELDSPGETTDVLTCFSACTNGNLCHEQRQDKLEI